MNRRTLVALAALAALAPAPRAEAQFKNGNQTTVLNLPRVSQRSVLTQRIGLTDVTITYHRPLANGRKIFGELIPFGRVWRAGANDNTTFEVSDPVTIEGHPLAAGRYGLHMIPGAAEWTVIFSANSTSWGSFSYDQKEDVLRVTVKPAVGPGRDALLYAFDDLRPDAATISMEWEKTVVPFKLAVDTKAITLASIRREMRHLPGYMGETYFDAAMYCVDNAFNYEEALEWINKAIEQEERFENVELKARIVQALGRPQESAALLSKALAMATPQQLFSYGELMRREKKLDAAKQFFTKQTAEHPDRWMNWLGLARVQVDLGDRAAAKTSLDKALEAATEPAQKANVRRLLDRLAAGQKIGG